LVLRGMGLPSCWYRWANKKPTSQIDNPLVGCGKIYPAHLLAAPADGLAVGMGLDSHTYSVYYNGLTCRILIVRSKSITSKII
jgi:hypothetical protein